MTQPRHFDNKAQLSSPPLSNLEDYSDYGFFEDEIFWIANPEYCPHIDFPAKVVVFEDRSPEEIKALISMGFHEPISIDHLSFHKWGTPDQKLTVIMALDALSLDFVKSSYRHCLEAGFSEACYI
ncbi:MAG: hypothetical protein F6K35_08815, partial [Okeania sp. SIO2H7]|nr:hypothetical protein [Okeania sp. SIO2H7]